MRPWTFPLPVLLLALALGSRTIGAEEVVETAEDGTVRVRYEVDEQGRKNGSYIRLHPNGQEAVRATYRAGKRHGLERTWDESGVLRSAHTYKAGVLHGAHKTYDEKGKLRLKQAFKNGVLHGSYKSYHVNRRLNVVASYRDGVRHGKFHERMPDGSTRLRTTYHQGRLNGAFEVFEGKTLVTKQVWERGEPIDVDGVVPFPRSMEVVRTELARLLTMAGELPADPLEVDRVLALQQLKAYRFLAGVPYRDIVMDPGYAALAQAGSEICAALGEITHKPRNPGWSAARFAAAAKGAISSNLHEGHRACTSVRGYMDDSDPRNIDGLGHRCWSLNPAMLKTGFGHEKGFTAMWGVDESRTSVPDYVFVSFPPCGHVPAQWFGPRWAWSVSLNPKRFDAPQAASVKARIEPLGANFLPTRAALELDYATVKQESVGIPYLVIFRAAAISLAPGCRYRVTLSGLTHKGKARPLRYFVQFFDLPYAKPAVTQR